MASPTSGRHQNPWVLTARDLRRILSAGLARLEAAVEGINRLNVFPVPDRDTGTNMFDTLRYTLSGSEPSDRETVSAFAAEIGDRALYGARGNSGVLLAEFLRGLAREMISEERIDVALLARGLKHGAAAARAAVASPVDGTILTVMNDTANAAERAGERSASLTEVLETAAAAARESLRATPSLLPVLRESGVVDAGGAGFVAVIEGMTLALGGRAPAASPAITLPLRPRPGRRAAVVNPPDAATGKSDLRGAETPPYGYCTELIVRSTGEKIEEVTLRQRLSTFGGSLFVIGTDELLRVHVHAADPGAVLSECLTHGSLEDISIRNMDRQTVAGGESSGRETPSEQVAVVAVVEGSGFSEIFKSLGAAVIEAADHDDGRFVSELIEVVETLPNGEVVILPNRPAGLPRAAETLDWRGKTVRSANTSTMPAGIAALIELDPASALDGNLARMNAAAAEIHTIAVELSKKQFSVALDGTPLGRSADLSGLLNAIVEAVPHNAELAAIYYSERAERERIDEVVGAVRAIVGRAELHFGGQASPLFLVSLE